jgi:hypothetical protein
MEPAIETTQSPIVQVQHNISVLPALGSLIEMEPAIETTQSPIVHVHKLFALYFHTKTDCFVLIPGKT